MPRVTLAHDDEAFRAELEAALLQRGFEVIAFKDSAFVTLPPRDTDRLEIAITGVAGEHTGTGVRIRVTGLAPGTAYAGPLSWLFSERATAADVMGALRRFVVSS